MNVNQGRNERIARVLAGLTLLKSANSTKCKLLGLVPLVTGATGYCPMKNMVFGDSHKHSKHCSHDHAKSRPSDSESKKTAEKMDEVSPA